MLAIIATLASGVAANNNAFTYPADHGIIVNAGDHFNIKWANASGPSVDLILRTGDPKVLQTVQTIATGIQNQGSYEWTIPSDLKTGSYTIEIEADGDENYSTYFTINGKNVTNSASANASANASSSGVLSNSSASASRTAISSSARSSSRVNSSRSKLTSSAGATPAPFVNGSSGNGTVGGANGTAVPIGGASASVSAPDADSTATESGASGSSASRSSAASSRSASSKGSNGANLQSWSTGAVAGAVAAAAMLMI